MAVRPVQTRGERSTWRTSAPHRRHRRSAVTQGSLPPIARGIPVALGAHSCSSMGSSQPPSTSWLMRMASGVVFFLSGSWWPLIA